MALIKDFEMKDTGLTIPNAYHVIGDVQLIKRTYEIPVGANTTDPLNGQPGYWGLIFVHIFASKQARDNGSKPVAYINSAMPEMSDLNFKFVYDPESSDSLLTQAYNHLKALDYYQNCIED